jgi:hypothetical protein
MVHSESESPPPAPLVGRDEILAELRAVVDAVPGGRGSVVVLTGEAGIGKTALATATADYAATRGACAVWAACWQGAPPFWPWLEVLRALGADVGRPESGAASTNDAGTARFEFFDAVSSALLRAAEASPLVVVLDDLHWADPASVLLAAFHARRMHPSRQVLVATYRDVEVSPDDPTSAPLAALEASATVMPLGGLDRPHVARMLATITGKQPGHELAATVQRRTGGNPFLVHQVARLMLAHPGGSAVPRGVRDVVERRLAHLGDPCARLLRVASVLGPELRPAVLARVVEEPVGAVLELLTEAARARVLTRPVTQLGGWRFSHDLFREVTYDEIDAAARARLHLRAAETLESLRDVGCAVRSAELAEHYQRAAGHDSAAAIKALDLGVLAAEEAAAGLAYEEAALHYRRALEVLDLTGDATSERRVGLLLGLGDALRRSGDTSGAREAFLQSVHLARRTGDGAGLARAALGLQALGVGTVAQPDELVSLLEEAITALAGRDLALTARVQAALARSLAWWPEPRRHARAAGIAEHAVASARASGGPDVLGAALLAQHDALWRPDSPEARLALLDELVHVAESSRDEELLTEAHLLRCTALLELGDPGAPRELRALTRRARDSSQPRVRWLGRSREATLAVLAGDLDHAERLIAEIAQRGTELEIPDVTSVGAVLGSAVDHLRGWVRDDLLDYADSVTGTYAGAVRAWAAYALLDRRGPAWAEAYVGDALDLDLEELPRNWYWTRFGVSLAAINVALGRTQACARLYDALAPHAARSAVVGGAVLFVGSVSHYVGLLAAATGRLDLARSHLEAAVAVHERLGARPWVVSSRLELARVLDRDGAGDLLSGVHDEAQRLGLAPLAGTASELLGMPDSSKGVFRRAGASWTISYAGRTVRLPDAKGLRDLAVLLSRPGEPVPAIDLVASGEGRTLARVSLGIGADPVLDARAKREYRHRLDELEDEIADAQALGDADRADRARAERESIAHELAAALGLAGRDRGLGDIRERARKAVTARLRDSLARITQAHPRLGQHLQSSLTTGTACAYQPADPITWQT